MMWPAAAAAPVVSMYKFYKSGAKTEVPDHISPYPPGGGGCGSGCAPPRLQEDRARPDLAPAVVDKILNLVNAHLDAFRNFKNPAGDIVDKVEKLWSEAETETETESPIIVQGTRLDHALSDLDPATLDEIRRLDPAVLDEILDQIRNQKARSFPPGECWTYLRTGTCKNRSSCKFKHPPRSKDKQNDFRSEGRNAKVRTFIRGQPSVPPAGENFLGLPIRPGEKDCPYYMQNGVCKYELNCKYNHPDPKGAGESDPVSTYGNGGPATFQSASPSTVELSSAPRSLNNTHRYVPPMVTSPSQNTELNSYQAPANLLERSMHVPQPYGINNSVTETTTYQQHPPEKLVCDSFSKTGYFHKSFECKYHHPPKYQTSMSPSCELSDKGLPLRPGQNICTQYRSYGICNSGPSCEFDHPSSPTSTL